MVFVFVWETNVYLFPLLKHVSFCTFERGWGMAVGMGEVGVGAVSYTHLTLPTILLV